MRGTHVDHESNLDALLEDLQTTVSRSNSSVGLNGQVTGYRSFRRTVTDGTPEGTSSEYQVEYLNPSNSTTQVVESSYQNSPNNFKNEKYNKYRAITSTSSSSTGDAKMKQNISELDSLLDDLNAAQKKNFSSSLISTSQNHSGIDPGLLEPATSTPAGSKLIQKLYREEKTTTSMRGRSPSPRGRELVFTGTRSRDPSPVPLDFHTSFETREETPNVQQVYRYEKTTTSRTTAPTVTTEYPSPYGTSSTITYADEAPLAITDRSPSPINRHNSSSTSYYNSINRDTTTHHDRIGYPRDHEPDSSPRYGSAKTAYSYSSTRESRSESRVPPPPPHRSPSPVSFNQPPLPGTKNSRSYADSSPPPTRRSQSPHQFSPSDPTHNKLTYNVSPPHANHSFKYTSTTTTTSNAYHDQPNHLKPRPFPTSPGEQQPPKKLDELLATLSDGNMPPPSPPPHDKYSETNVHRYTSHHTSTHHSSNGYAGRNVGNGHPPASPATPEHSKTVTIVEQTDLGERQPEREKLIEKTESKGASGPPVYYPPGVELFTKKEEAMMQKQEGGSKYKAMAKYEYEAKSKSKHTETSGKAVVPVCLPVCCAMPCSIM
ncbi:Hypothetical protein NTJ_00224 [Nesidiocoris tenuis]|nr:Hypothetical protein NTJ_00224 [Nesidiocoris tenuis]